MRSFRGNLSQRNFITNLGGTNPIPGISDRILALIPFQRLDGNRFLIVITQSTIFSWNGSSWTNLTPNVPVVKFSKKSGSNGWSVLSGSFSVGDRVTQGNFLGSSTGIWQTPDTNFYYIQVLGGTFYENNISNSTRAGVLSLSGTDPAATAQIVAGFDMSSSHTAYWQLSSGGIPIGTSIYQETTPPTLISGIYLGTQGTSTLGTFFITMPAGNFVSPKYSASVPQISDPTSNGYGLYTNGTSTLFAYYINNNSSLTSDVNVPTITHHIQPSTFVSLQLNGTATSFIDSAQGDDVKLGRVIVFTNGVDPPIYWDGVNTTAVYLNINLANFVTAKSVTIYNNYLLFGNVVTTTDIEPRTIVWSDTGNFQEWLAGNSGELDEIAVTGNILRLIPFSGKIAIIAEQSIATLYAVDPNIIFGVTTVVTGIQLIGPWGVANVNPYVYFIAPDNIYAWSGGSYVTPIGDKVASFIKALDPATAYLTQLFYNQPDQELRIGLFTFFGTALNSLVLEIDTTSTGVPRWFYDSEIAGLTAFGLYQATGQGLPSYVFSDVNGNVYQGTKVSADSIAFLLVTYETKDFTIPQEYESLLARWLEFEFEVTGTDGSGGLALRVAYSTDLGQTYNTIIYDPNVGQPANQTAIIMSSTPTSYKLFLDITSRHIRFRFSTQTTNIPFTISWYKVWFRPGGAR